MPPSTRREFIEATLGAASAVAATGAAAGCGTPTGRRPNLLYVFPDQMRGQALGFMEEDPVVRDHILDRADGEGGATKIAAGHSLVAWARVVRGAAPAPLDWPQRLREALLAGATGD